MARGHALLPSRNAMRTGWKWPAIAPPMFYWIGLKAQKVYPAVGEVLDLDIGLHTVKKFSDIPVPSRDVTYLVLPGRE